MLYYFYLALTIAITIWCIYWFYGNYSKLARFLNRFVLISYDENTTFLFEVFESLKDKFQSKDYKYRLPWVLIVHQSKPEYELLSGQVIIFENYKATLSDDGVIIEIYQWNSQSRHLVELISNHKSTLPLDSIVLTIPVAQLQTKDQALLTQREYNNRIQLLQKLTNFTLPLYLLVVDLETLDGFNAFAEQIPIKQDVFGWSRPKSAEVLAKDLFWEYVQENLLRVQQTLLTQSGSEAKDLILFVQSFMKLGEGLKILFDQKCNGIYFTGMYKEKSLFVERLFGSKIFIERGLAIRNTKALLTRNYWLMLLQLLTVSCACFLIYTFFANNSKLRILREKTYPKIEIIQDLIDKYHNERIIDRLEYVNDVQILLMNIPNYDQYFGATMPASYLSGLWYQKDQIISKLHQNLIIDRLYEHMQADIQALFALPAKHSNGMFIEQSAQFQELTDFANKLAKINKINTDLQIGKQLEGILQDFYNISDIKIEKALNYKPKPLIWPYEDLRKIWSEKSELFFKEISPGRINHRMRSLQEQLQQLLDDKANLIQLKQELMEVLNWIETEAVVMFDKTQVSIGQNWPDFAHSLTLIRPIIGSGVIDQFYSRLDSTFKQAKTALLSARAPIVGFLIAQDDDGALHGAPELYKLLGLLNTLISQDFIQRKQGKYFTFDAQVLDAAAKKTHLPDEFMKDIAIKILSQYLNDSLLADNPSKPTGHGVAGSVFKIFEFARANNQNLFEKLVQGLVESAEHELGNVWDQIGTMFDLSKEYIINQQTFKTFFKKQTQILTKVLSEHQFLLDILDTLDYEEFPATIQQIIFLWRQIKNPTDLSLLQESVLAIIANPASKQSWQGDAGYLQDKFQAAMEALQKYYRTQRLDEFEAAFAPVANIYNSKLRNSVPFVNSGVDAHVSDVMALYSELDQVLKQYSLDWIESNVPVDHLVYKILRNRPVLEPLAKGEEMTLQMQVLPLASKQELTQVLLSINGKQVDFRNGRVEAKVSNIHQVKVSARLSQASKFWFNGKMKTVFVETEGPWAIQRMLHLPLVWNLIAGESAEKLQLGLSIKTAQGQKLLIE